MSFNQPSVDVFGLEIGEPVTSLTALMISGICLYAFIKLSKIPSTNKALLYLRNYFFLMSAATALGGIIGHALLIHLSFEWKLIGWVTSMVSIMYIERAAIENASFLIHDKYFSIHPIYDNL